jgi:hypothetical protein
LIETRSPEPETTQPLSTEATPTGPTFTRQADHTAHIGTYGRPIAGQGWIRSEGLDHPVGAGVGDKEDRRRGRLNFHPTALVELMTTLIETPQTCSLKFPTS